MHGKIRQEFYVPGKNPAGVLCSTGKIAGGLFLLFLRKINIHILAALLPYFQEVNYETLL
jgi:hypothetical protein